MTGDTPPLDADRLPPVLLLGFGRMGGALAAGWSRLGLAPSFAVDPAGRSAGDLTCVPSLADVPDRFAPAAVVLAVKPQMAASAVPPFARYAGRAVFLSIMAGLGLGWLRRALGEHACVVRAMPNTPAAIGEGVSVACAGPGVDPAQRVLCTRLLEAGGAVAWTEQEALLDAVTAISGSGPAYVFLLAELLEQAGIAEGLPPDLARLLARRTVSGAGALLAASDQDAAALRIAVTSPKGTTEQALAVLMAEWPPSLRRAVAAAAARSRALGQ